MLKILSFSVSALVALTMVAGTAAAADAGAGEGVFKKRCKACHTLEAGKNKVGPALFGVVGRQAGTMAKFKYSKSYVKAGEDGLSWSEEEIIKYLADPKKYMRAKIGDKKAKSKMVFKLKSEEDRQNVAAYLATVK